MADVPLLTKDAVNVMGHKIPIPLIGALAAVAGVVLVLRARSQGGQVASVGSQPATLPGDLSGFGSSFAPDPSAALTQIQAQLQSLQGSLAGQQAMSAPTPAPSPAPAPPPVIPTPAPPPPAPPAPPPALLVPLPQPVLNLPPSPAPATAPPRTPIFAKPLAFLQLHAGDTPQSLANYWDQHGFNFSAQQLIDSNRMTPFAPGNTWLVWGAGQGPNTVVGFQ